MVVQYLKNSDIGNPLRGGTFVVTPQNVKNALLGLPLPEYTCKCHGVTTTSLAVNPYASEIHGVTLHMVACDECLDSLAWDI